VAVLGVGSAMAASPGKVADYKPSGPWAVDYGDDYCRLSRDFTDGNETLALAFERIQPRATMRMIVVSDAIKPFRGVLSMGWHFLPSDPERPAFFLKSETTDGKAYFNLGTVGLEAPSGDATRNAVVRGPLPPIVPLSTKERPLYVPPPPDDRAKELATAKSLTGFILDQGLDKAIEVDTGNLGQPIGALQACADDLAKSWGLDPAKLQTEQTPPIPEDGGVGWLPQGIVGPGGFAKLAGASNQVRLMVDAAGKPTACAVHWATLDRAINEQICDTLMVNAKFTPAKDASGQPIPGYWMASPQSMWSPVPSGGKR
jgi:hypothetical protein